MSSKSLSKPSQQNAMSQIKHNIPIQLTDLFTFDNSYAVMRDRFDLEMRRVEELMHKLSKDLTVCVGETSNTGFGSPQCDKASNWEVLQNSQLVMGEGEKKALNLQFDVRGFDTSEIKVKLMDDVLIITAIHEEKTKDTAVYREYNRQFKLPPGTDPESLITSLSRDGVLTVQAPLLLPTTPE